MLRIYAYIAGCASFLSGACRHPATRAAGDERQAGNTVE
jgi:hypothetical protein